MDKTYKSNVSLIVTAVRIFPPGPAESNTDFVIWEPCPGQSNTMQANYVLAVIFLLSKVSDIFNKKLGLDKSRDLFVKRTAFT